MQTIDSYTVARSYVRDFDKIKNNRKNSVIFMGSVGGGKTHLSLAIANELMKKGVFLRRLLIILIIVGMCKL